MSRQSLPMTLHPLLADVAALTVVPQGASGATSYTYGIVGVDVRGKKSLVETDVEASGNAVLDGVNFNRMTWSDIAGYVSYELWRTASAGTPATVGLIGTVLAGVETFDDIGLAAVAGTASAANTTGEGVALPLQHYNGDLNVSLQDRVDGTFQLQGAFGGDAVTGGKWLDEGAALTADNVLVVTKKYVRVRMVTTVVFTAAPKVFCAGDNH